MRRNVLLLIAGAFALTFLSCAIGYEGPYGETEGNVVVQGGVALEFDSGLGVWVVRDYPGYYYFGGYYYRAYDGDRYERSRHIDRDWRDIDPSRMPPGLASKYGYRERGEYDHGRENDQGRDRGNHRGDERRHN